MQQDRERDADRTTVLPDDEDTTPYDEGDVSPWYGGDTGLGEATENGSELDDDQRRQIREAVNDTKSSR